MIVSFMAKPWSIRLSGKRYIMGLAHGKGIFTAVLWWPYRRSERV